VIPCIPSFQFLEELPGRELVLVPGQTVEARAAARELLESLLDERQLADWRQRGVFKVPTPFGNVVLGRLFDIGLERPGRRRMQMCVVPNPSGTCPKKMSG